MSTNKKTPQNYDAPDARIAGPTDESFAEDITSKMGTGAIIALLVVVTVIFFAALFANGLYRSQLKQTVQDQGASSAVSASGKAIAASAKRAEESGAANSGALLLEDGDTLAGSPAEQVAKDGDVADIPELPSYAAVLDPEAAALAAAAEEASDEDAEDDSDAEEEADNDGTTDADENDVDETDENDSPAQDDE